MCTHCSFCVIFAGLLYFLMPDIGYIIVFMNDITILNKNFNIEMDMENKK